MSGRCAARTRQDKPCRGTAGPLGLCNFHLPAAQAGRVKGGKRRYGDAELRSLRPLVNRLVEELHRVAQGKTPPDRLKAMASGVDSLVRLVDMVSIQDELKKLKKVAGLPEEED